jgi:ATP-dependent RNA helicase DeaD
VHRIGRTGRIGRDGVALTLVDPRERRLLRNIESFTRQQIAVHPLPTSADVHARRLERMREALREQIVAARADRDGGGKRVSMQTEARDVVAALSQEFSLEEIAAAAVAMANEAAAPRAAAIAASGMSANESAPRPSSPKRIDARPRRTYRAPAAAAGFSRTITSA